MRRVNIVLVVLCILFAVLNVVQFVVWRSVNTQTTEKYTAQVMELQQKINSYGSDVQCVTVISSVKPGDIVTQDVLDYITVPSSVVTDQFVTSMDDVIGRVFKIGVNAGTPLMTNMTMEEVIDDDMRDRDIMLDRVTVGLHVGDYIDIRITMPYGDEYVVIPHKRVYAINENTIKLYLSEYEWALYQGAMVDYYLNEAYGCTIYADRYIEPGLQNSAIAYYAPPSNIAALIAKNPNILDDIREESIKNSTSWRNAIEELFVIFRDEEDTVDADASKLSSGRKNFNQSVESDRQSEAQEDEEAGTTETDTEYEDDNFWSDTPVVDTSNAVEGAVEDAAEMTDDALEQEGN